jgi:16S rRNA (adenine1518-N6/adenine1519-N6)-dimethyltransferase
MPNQIQNQNIKNLLGKYKIKPSKRFGQNFLTDDSVLEKIIAAADLSENDTVLEIGPGLGILTLALAKKVKKVVAVEKDETLIGVLNNELRIKNIKNVEIIQDDILKISNVKIQMPNQAQSSNYKIVANLPYYITSPVIRLFLEKNNKPGLMVLMVQKEVAQRICSQLGQMSILAVAVQFYAHPEIIAMVSKTSFYPEPKVDSAIIRIIPKKDLPKINTKKFFELIRAGFSSKRKLLINNISEKIQIPKSKLQILFDQIKFDQKIRAENLSVESWLKIYENIEKDI